MEFVHVCSNFPFCFVGVDVCDGCLCGKFHVLFGFSGMCDELCDVVCVRNIVAIG